MVKDVIYFEPLLKSIRLQVVDDEQKQLEFYSDMLSEHEMYTIVTSPNAAEAEKSIKSNVRPHLCILDLGIDDIKDDEFYLLKKYGEKIPFVIISGSADMERAFIATKAGAAGMIAKPPDITNQQFWNTLKDVFLTKSILPAVTRTANSVIVECCRVLKNKLPQSVAEWAASVNVTDTYLRRLWTECYNCHPKHVLFLYLLYKDALEYHDERYLADINDRTPHPGTFDKNAYRRRIDYYLQNKRKLDAIKDKL